MKKKLFLLGLTLITSFTFLACGTPKVPDVEISELSSADVGDYIVYGSYEQDANVENGSEAIEWIVLERDGDYILVMSRLGLEMIPYDDSSNVWAYSDLRSWLNNDFYNEAFTEKEQEQIQTTYIFTNDSFDRYRDDLGSFGGPESEDKIWILDQEDFENYAMGPSYASEYVIEKGAMNFADDGELPLISWWIRLPGAYSNEVCACGSYCILDFEVDKSNICVRPVMWISTK